MPENDAFSRDLGYLDKFFDKLETHAGTLPSDTGQRLRALLADERKAWAEIKQLVGVAGAPPAAATAPAAQPEAAAPAEPPVRPYTRALQIGLAQLPREPAAPAAVGAASGGGAENRPSRGLTVGSLKARR